MYSLGGLKILMRQNVSSLSVDRHSTTHTLMMFCSVSFVRQSCSVHLWSKRPFSEMFSPTVDHAAVTIFYRRVPYVARSNEYLTFSDIYNWHTLDYVFCNLLVNFHRTLCIRSVDHADARRLSVCLCVCLSHGGIVSKRPNISSNYFHHWLATPF